jgi:hypothetical protein
MRQPRTRQTPTAPTAPRGDLMTNSLTNTILTAGPPALAAAASFLAIAMFQTALALGAPLGRAAWGGIHDGQLPTSFRIASACAVIVWALAAVIVLGRAGVDLTPLPMRVVHVGTWVLVGILLVGALMNVASSSPWERYMWAPFTLTLAVLCLLVARSASSSHSG